MSRGDTWKHIKRGSIYTELYRGKYKGKLLLNEGAPLVVNSVNGLVTFDYDYQGLLTTGLPVVFGGILQQSRKEPLHHSEKLVMYRGTEVIVNASGGDSIRPGIWIRLQEEFMDGRFVKVLNT